MLMDIQYYNKQRSPDGFYSTAGVVVLDNTGNLSAGTSTGGIRQKMPGRVGDSAIPGAGTFCCKDAGAVATGEGEGIIRIGLTKKVVELNLAGVDLSDACKQGIREGSNIDCICGVVSLNRKGEFSYAHNGSFMAVYMNKE